MLASVSVVRPGRVTTTCWGNKPPLTHILKCGCDTELEQKEGRLQEASLVSEAVPAQHLRLTIHTGHDHFCSVHRLQLEGQLQAPRQPFPATPQNDASKPDLRKNSNASTYSQRDRYQDPPAPELSSGWSTNGIHDDDEDDDEDDDVDEDEVEKIGGNDEEDDDDSVHNVQPYNFKVADAPQVTMMQSSGLRTVVHSEGIMNSDRSPSRGLPAPLQVQPQQRPADEFIYGIPDEEEDL
ncbi:hypothetical protein FHG87_010809 [Trinorchestia longiramus]|nr:hypothetical protein FHG87_010809 [Trinorchestia longiramus]